MVRLTECDRVKMTEEILMGQTERKGEEATAVERVANAAREVQLASQAIEEKFNMGLDQADRALPLARLTAAITELQAARDALDALLARKSLH
jgi:hypothetical protein